MGQRFCRTGAKQSKAPLQELQAARALLLGQLGAPLAIETPELGRVEHRTAQDIEAALGILDGQIAAAAGTAGVRVQVLSSARGLG